MTAPADPIQAQVETESGGGSKFDLAQANDIIRAMAQKVGQVLTDNERLTAELAAVRAVAPRAAPNEPVDADGLSWDADEAWCASPCGRTFEDRETALSHIGNCGDCTQMRSAADPVRVRLAQISEKIDALDEQLANDHDGNEPCREMCGTGSGAADSARALLAAVNAVLDLHQPYNNLCEECSDEDLAPWPCVTYQGVAAALGVTE